MPQLLLLTAPVEAEGGFQACALRNIFSFGHRSVILSRHTRVVFTCLYGASQSSSCLREPCAAPCPAREADFRRSTSPTTAICRPLLPRLGYFFCTSTPYSWTSAGAHPHWQQFYPRAFTHSLNICALQRAVLPFRVVGRLAVCARYLAGRLMMCASSRAVCVFVSICGLTPANSSCVLHPALCYGEARLLRRGYFIARCVIFVLTYGEQTFGAALRCV